MFDRGSPWDGQHNGRPAQEPGKCNLRWAGIVCLRDSIEHLTSNLACPEWGPGDKKNCMPLTIIHHVVPFAIREAIAVLHRDDWHDSACSLDVLLRDVRQPDHANLPFVSQLSQGFYG